MVKALGGTNTIFVRGLCCSARFVRSPALLLEGCLMMKLESLPIRGTPRSPSVQTGLSEIHPRRRLLLDLAASLSARRIEHLQRTHSSGAPSFHTELFKYFLDVLLHRGFSDPENCCNVHIRLSLR